jgi:hypothetical protein
MPGSSNEEKSSKNGARLSVVLACPGGYDSIATTVAALRRQTVANQMQLLFVSAKGSRISAELRNLRDFASVKFVSIAGPISVARANAAGVHQATESVVAFTEDHSFPDPGWAESLIKAHEQHWAAVGPAVRNANPATAVSWADFFIGYGPWAEPISAGTVDFLPGHNSSYKRAVLLKYEGGLEDMLEAETILHWELRKKGHELYLEPNAKTSHANFSLFSSWVQAQFFGGWVFGGSRVLTMSLFQRLLYLAGAPLIPFVRFVRICRHIMRTKKNLDCPMVRLLPVLLFGLAIDGVGQMLGYALGVRSSKEKLAHLEYHRIDHVTAADREMLKKGEYNGR